MSQATKVRAESIHKHKISLAVYISKHPYIEPSFTTTTFADVPASNAERTSKLCMSFQSSSLLVVILNTFYWPNIDNKHGQWSELLQNSHPQVKSPAHLYRDVKRFRSADSHLFACVLIDHRFLSHTNIVWYANLQNLPSHSHILLASDKTTRRKSLETVGFVLIPMKFVMHLGRNVAQSLVEHQNDYTTSINKTLYHRSRWEPVLISICRLTSIHERITIIEVLSHDSHMYVNSNSLIRWSSRYNSPKTTSQHYVI